jgi:excisionase family DNA binding protein
VPDLNPPTEHLGDDPWLTLAEVADELRVNPSTVRSWVSQGRLSASRAGRRKWLVRRSELEGMLASKRSAEPWPADAGAGPVRPPMPGDRLIVDSGGGGGEGSGG